MKPLRQLLLFVTLFTFLLGGQLSYSNLVMGATIHLNLDLPSDESVMDCCAPSLSNNHATSSGCNMVQCGVSFVVLQFNYMQFQGDAVPANKRLAFGYKTKLTHSGYTSIWAPPKL